MKPLSSFFSVLLTPLLALSPIWAQEPAVNPGSAAAPLLQVHLVDGGLNAVPGSRQQQSFAVQVADAAGAPVADAAVAIRLPDSGPTGAFADGSHAAVAYTDATGRAKFPAVQWGDLAGTADLRITAAKGSIHAGLLLEQVLAPLNAKADSPVSQNTAKAAQPGTPVSVKSQIAQTRSGADAGAPSAVPNQKQDPAVSITSAAPGSKSHSNKKWYILAGVAVAAGVGAAVALSGKGAATAATTTTALSVGTPSISIGHP